MSTHKKEVVRLIMKLMPEWDHNYTHVRFDRDGEVCVGDGDHFNRSKRIGFVGPQGGPVRNEHRAVIFPYFVPSQILRQPDGAPENLIGYSFDRFEYEIYRAAILEEQDDEQTTD